MSAEFDVDRPFPSEAHYRLAQSTGQEQPPDDVGWHLGGEDQPDGAKPDGDDRAS
jgi:hypothetical protein